MSVPTEVAPDILFNGVDGNECEAFVFAIQKHAFEIGRDEDYNWMLRFARTGLKAKALRWYARLDPSIKKDWDLFVQALFDQYPSVGEPDEAEIATPVWSATTFSPSHSTATLPQTSENQSNAVREGSQISQVPHGVQPPRQGLSISHGAFQQPSATRVFDPSSSRQQVGLLRIVNEAETSLPQYIWWGCRPSQFPATGNGALSKAWRKATVNRHEALVVSFVPADEPHQIGCLNCRTNQASLAVNYSSGPAVESYRLVGSNGDALAPSTETMNTSCMTKIWNVLADGTLQVSLSSFSLVQSGGQTRYEEIKFNTTEVHLNISGQRIRFAKAGTLLPQDKPNGNPTLPFVRARIVFEPL